MVSPCISISPCISQCLASTVFVYKICVSSGLFVVLILFLCKLCCAVPYVVNVSMLLYVLGVVICHSMGVLCVCSVCVYLCLVVVFDVS